MVWGDGGMTDARPTPYPGTTKAKGWRFELDLEQVMQSDTWALATPDVRPWLLMLWATAWQQIPCGSLPSDDELIAARLGMPLKAFQKAKPVLLRSWWLAEDGRLYHDTIASRVLDMLGRKDAERARKAEYRARKDAERRLLDAPGQPQEHHVGPNLSHGTETGQTWDSSGSDDTGTGTGTGLDSSTPLPRTASAPAGTPAGHACRLLKGEGIADCNPGHPVLIALMASGVSADELIGAAQKAKKAGAGFAYVLKVIQRTREEAKAMASGLHTGPLPQRSTQPSGSRYAGAAAAVFEGADHV